LLNQFKNKGESLHL